LGLNPYLVGPSALPAGEAIRGFVGQRWFDTPIAYGPLLADAARIAGASGRVTVQLLVYKGLLLGAALATVGVAFAFVRTRRAGAGDGEAARAFAALGPSPLFAWEVAGEAHNDGVMVAATMAFL